jgi:prepilin-type N-terminal cleavage/methylation domain-containing protein
MKHFRNTKKGMTLVEILIATAILVLIMIGISRFQRDIFFLNSSTQNNLSAQMEGRKVLRILVAELRSANRSSLGAYPIVTAGTSTLTFYSNIDSDAYFERLRYFVDGTKLKRGVIKPSGNPLVYNSAQEDISTLINDLVVATTTPLFEYFSSTYIGTTTALVQPVNTQLVRLVRITLSIDKDPSRPPSPLIIRSQGMLRNLKDNQ